MLSRIRRWLFGPPSQPCETTVDPTALAVVREQRRLAHHLSAITGKTPEQLLDYRRADAAWSRDR